MTKIHSGIMFNFYPGLSHVQDQSEESELNIPVLWLMSYITRQLCHPSYPSIPQ